MSLKEIHHNRWDKQIANHDKKQVRLIRRYESGRQVKMSMTWLGWQYKDIIPWNENHETLDQNGWLIFVFFFSLKKKKGRGRRRKYRRTSFICTQKNSSPLVFQKVAHCRYIFYYFLYK